ncbi:MAG: TAXI family TRAP transporter solute-binding subunit [Pseudomonadota bacterium]
MRIGLFLLGGLVAVALSGLLIRDLLPPRTLTFAAGTEGGGYARIAERYRAILARDRIRVDVLETAGSGENAVLLGDGSADVALLQGGIQTTETVASLAALFVEPLFVFTRRGDTGLMAPERWSEVRLASGPEGSGTAAAIVDLLRAVGMPGAFPERLPLGGADAVSALRDGRADAAVFVAPITAPYIQDLLHDPEFELIQLNYVDAIARRLPQSSVVRLPAGAISLDPALPPEDIRLIALVARLAARDDLHPALVDRLVEAAREIHTPRTALTEEGRYPTTRGLKLPINSYAENLIENGASPLQDHLPFWVVAQINRVALLALPIIFLLLPLIRLAPGVYAWRMRGRVFRHYQTIRDIDERARSLTAPDTLNALIAELEALDSEIAALSLPLHYRDHAYTARLHIDLLRRKLMTERDAGMVIPTTHGTNISPTPESSATTA